VGTVAELKRHLLTLRSAIEANRAEPTCRRHWSRFIRLRDGNLCVICGDPGRAAHHVLRKSVFRPARFETGNGVTLCGDCHAEAHDGFNGRADLSLPLDYEGGEKLEGAAELFRFLAKAFRCRYPEHPEFYFLSDRTLTSFKRAQGFDPLKPLAGSPIEQAWYIWDCAPPPMVEALIRANFPQG
jgi:hypothetical protein